MMEAARAFLEDVVCIGAERRAGKPSEQAELGLSRTAAVNVDVQRTGEAIWR